MIYPHYEPLSTRKKKRCQNSALKKLRFILVTSFYIDNQVYMTELGRSLAYKTG